MLDVHLMVHASYGIILIFKFALYVLLLIYILENLFSVVGWGCMLSTASVYKSFILVDKSYFFKIKTEH